MLMYAVPAWPEEDYTVAVRVRLDEMPKGRLGQIFSAWAAAMDDPLRLVVEQGKLFARIESGGVFGTPGVPIDAGRWHHVCAVKRGETLALFLDGQPAGSCAAPRFTTTAARECALGGNPHFSGDESLTATFADFGFWERALSAEELQRLAHEPAPHRRDGRRHQGRHDRRGARRAVDLQGATRCVEVGVERCATASVAVHVDEPGHEHGRAESVRGGGVRSTLAHGSDAVVADEDPAGPQHAVADHDGVGGEQRVHVVLTLAVAGTA